MNIDLKVKWEDVEEVVTVTYLGVMIRAGGGMREEVNQRLL